MYTCVHTGAFRADGIDQGDFHRSESILGFCVQNLRFLKILARLKSFFYHDVLADALL